MTSVLVLFLQPVRIFVVVSPSLISLTRSMFVYVLLCVFLCVYLQLRFKRKGECRSR